MPKLSIIIPVLNNLEGLKQSINSIKAQNFNSIEVWVIDGGSSIETQDYLNSLEKPFYYQSRVDKGIYDAMNKGIALAKGDWLYFLGSGDVLYNTNVLKSVFDNQLNENKDIIAGKVIYEGTTKPFIHSKSKVIKNVSWSALMWIRNGLHHQGTFYKNSLFKSKNYNLKYKVLSDYWFNLWLYKSNTKCNIVDVIVAKCNSDGVSKSGKWAVYQEEIALKTAITSKMFLPFFYSIALKKFIFRKIINVG